MIAKGSENRTAPPLDEKKGFYYGHVIVLSGFLIFLVIYGAQYCFGIFFKPVLQDFGWNRAETSGAYSLYVLMYGFSCMFAGRIGDRFGCRLTVTFWGVLLGAGYLMLSRTSALWQLYLFYGLVAVAHGGIYVPIASTQARWFLDKRALMNGIMVTGVSVGQIVMSPVATVLVTGLGWRSSYCILGAFCLILIVILAQVFRKSPFEKGNLRSLPKRTEERDMGKPEYSLKQAFLSTNFIVLAIAWIFYGYFVQSCLAHIVPYATDLEISAINASTILSIIGGIGIVGRVMSGTLGDKLGNRVIVVIGFALSILSFIWLLFSRELWMLYVFAVLFGFSYAAISAAVSPLVAELFHLKYHGAILGVIIFAYSIGGMIGPVVTGRIFDVSGSYFMAFLVFAFVSVVSLILSSRLKSVESAEKLFGAKNSGPKQD